MRAKQFIFEYNQAKTAEVFGNKLIAALLVDKGSFPTMDMARQRTLLLSPDMKDIPLDEQTRGKILSDILRAIESADPTANKSYVPWLVRCYANEGVKFEDIMSKGKDWLETYTKMKLKKIIPGTSRYANIMNIKFNELYIVINQPQYLEKLQAAEQAAMSKGESTVFLNNDAVRIIVPLDVEAAVYYGQGTQWCTAARNNNMFDRYFKGGEHKMYIFLPKQPQYDGEKYQIHPASGQFMDEQDDPIDDAYHFLSTRFGDLVQFFRWNDPHIGKMIVFADDEVLQKALDGIKEETYEYINEKVDRWSDGDNGYDQWLRDEGYVDENGDVDWDRAPGYLEYDSDAQDEYNRLVSLVTYTAKEVKQAVPEYIIDDETDSPTVDQLDRVVAYIIAKTGNRDERDANEYMADWILKNVAVDNYGQVTRIRLSRTGKVTPR